jgi:arabinofuranosyltransferase
MSDADTRRLIIRIGMTIVLGVVIRTAWISDDAFITFRTADNIVHGYGARWNVDERVQSYTHPLWLGIFTAAYAITREPYYTALALSIVLTMIAVRLLTQHLALTPWHAVALFAGLISSKAFVDYATSGLENALTYVLLLTFLWRWWVEPPGTRRTRRLFLIGSLVMVNRMDLLLLVGPALAIEIGGGRLRHSVGAAVTGMLPFIAWELFSVVYYGFLFPNTAYAKLQTGLPQPELIRRGLEYAVSTALFDPVTLPLIAAALLTVAARPRRDWPLAAGVVAYTAYVAAIGGDFMLGRFFTPQLIWSAGLLAHTPIPQDRITGPVAAAALVLLGLCAPWEPAALSGFGYWRFSNLLHHNSSPTPWDNYRYLRFGDADDERRMYYDTAGLFQQRGAQPTPPHIWAIEGAAMRAKGRHVVISDSVGFRGYFAGPAVHIVDRFALCDPLLARLPPRPGGRIGHFLREVPAGYVETLSSGVNSIADPDVGAYYKELRLIVAGPIWSAARMKAILRLSSLAAWRAVVAPSTDRGLSMRRAIAIDRS